MAISVVHTTAANSLTVTIPSTTAGNCLIVCVMSFNTTAQASVSGVTLGGAAGNFAQAATPGHAGTGGLFADAFMWADPNCSGGQTSVVISGTNLSAATADGGVVVFEVSGLAASSVRDQTAPGGGVLSGTTWSSGTSPTTTQASEIWVGCADANGPSSPAGWTNTTPTGSFSIAGWQIVSSTGTATYNGTQTVSGVAAATAATFFAVPSLGPAGTVQPRPALPPARRKRGRGWLQFTPVTTANAAPPPPVTGTVQSAATLPARRRKLLRGIFGGTAVPGIQGKAPVQQFQMPPRRKRARAWIRNIPVATTNTPPHRQLLISLASKAGTDDYANAFPQGILATAGTIQGPEFVGNDFIISTSGSFFYNGTPASGNLVASIAPGDGTDAFSNAYLAGVSSYVLGSGGTVFASNMLAGVVSFLAAPSVSGAFTIFGTIGFSFVGTTGHINIQSTDGIGVSLNGNNLTIPQSLSGSIGTLPTDNNSGTGWVSGERAFMNNNWVATTNNNFAAIVAALQAAGITV